MLNHYYLRLVLTDLPKKHRQILTIHLMSAILIFTYSIYYFLSYQEDWMTLSLTIPISITIFIFSLFRKKILLQFSNHLIFRILESAILFMAFLFFFKNNMWAPAALFFIFSILLVLFLYIENRILQAQYIDIFKDKITIALPTHNKHIYWKDIQQIILKGDYISIVKNNDIILQYPIVNAFTQDEHEDFKNFCLKQIAQNNSL